MLTGTRTFIGEVREGGKSVTDELTRAEIGCSY